MFNSLYRERYSGSVYKVDVFMYKLFVCKVDVFVYKLNFMKRHSANRFTPLRPALLLAICVPVLL